MCSLARAYFYLAPLEQARQCLLRLLLLKLVQISSIFQCQASHLRLSLISSFFFLSLDLYSGLLFFFFSAGFSSFLLQWFGEGEKYVKAVFSLASKIAPSVVFVDEVSFI